MWTFIIQCLLMACALSQNIPHIDVQSSFSEIYSSANDQFTTITGYLIIIQAQFKQSDDTLIPMNSSECIELKTLQNLPILITFQDDFKQILLSNQSSCFPLNNAGRFSFSIPVQDQSSAHMPALLLKTRHFPKNQWYLHFNYIQARCLSRLRWIR
jgi:hypothetical protein